MTDLGFGVRIWEERLAAEDLLVALEAEDKVRIVQFFGGESNRAPVPPGQSLLVAP